MIIDPMRGFEGNGILPHLKIYLTSLVCFIFLFTFRCVSALFMDKPFLVQMFVVAWLAVSLFVDVVHYALLSL